MSRRLHMIAGSMHPRVVPEVSVEQELKAAAESSGVPLRLISKSVKMNDVMIDMVGVFHLQLGELVFNDVDVIQIAKTFVEVVPEHINGLCQCAIFTVSNFDF